MKPDPQPGTALCSKGATPRIAIGTMCGTSLDGLDAVWIEATGQGLGLRARVLAHAECGLGELALPLALAARQEPLAVGDLARLGMALGLLHAELITSRPDLPLPDLIAVHGQTLYHGRDASYALFDGTPLLGQVACPVVSELRLVDRAAGGEGAPITPLADFLLLAGARPRAVLNLGGFANVTRLPARGGELGAVTGQDLVPCNQLLDEAARRFLAREFDEDGLAAACGAVDGAALEALLQRLAPKAPTAPRSLGTGDEGWALLEPLSSLAPEHALATLCAALGRILAAGAQGAPELLLFGGGAKNLALVHGIEQAARREHSEVRVVIGSPEDPKLNAQAREGAAMAVLGLAAQDGLAITLPQVTGRGPTQHLDGRWWLPRPKAKA